VNTKTKTDVEREQLFDDGSSDVHTPRKKSTQEILTKYKFKGVISFPQHNSPAFPVPR